MAKQANCQSDEQAGVCFRVLGYWTDEEEWAAHCLETDLVGYGKSFKQAINHLHELTMMQLGFAMQSNSPEVFLHPAPPWVHQYFEDAQREEFWREMVLSVKDYRNVQRRTVGHMHVPRPQHGAEFAVAGD